MLQNTTGRRLTDSGRDSPPPQRRARASLPATCGELVQGTLGGQPCLVSCPIGRYSLAEVQLDAGSGWKTPDNAPKSTAAIQAGLAYVGRPDLGGQLRLVSDLPRSRGYGSSNAPWRLWK
jgi:L-threonine kinase